MIAILKNTRIDFMGKRYYAFVVTAILTALGLLGLFKVVTGSANLGIDFAGGTSVQIKFEKRVSLQEIRDALGAAGLSDVELQDMPLVNKVLIKVKRQQQEVGALTDPMISALQAKFTDNVITVDSVTEIGPKVGDRLRKDALWAVLAATLGILVYIAWRFQFQFSVGATLATFHDVLVVLGIFVATGREINLIVVTALLTIAGYSLTDTVVVFDRIRENLRTALKEPVIAIVNRSLNEVLSRTIITSVTTLLAAVALFVFGGEVIHDFALAMILGIIVGTYSSIFVASPVVLMWKMRKPAMSKK